MPRHARKSANLPTHKMLSCTGEGYKSHQNGFENRHSFDERNDKTLCGYVGGHFSPPGARKSAHPPTHTKLSHSGWENKGYIVRTHCTKEEVPQTPKTPRLRGKNTQIAGTKDAKRRRFMKN